VKELFTQGYVNNSHPAREYFMGVQTVSTYSSIREGLPGAVVFTAEVARDGPSPPANRG
jgi:hypothetical protein